MGNISYATPVSIVTASAFETVKVFDLAQAPASARRTPEMEQLRPRLQTFCGAIVRVIVGGTGADAASPAIESWLLQEGAVAGETVLLTWTAEA